jgi:hypothetical protein
MWHLWGTTGSTHSCLRWEQAPSWRSCARGRPMGSQSRCSPILFFNGNGPKGPRSIQCSSGEFTITRSPNKEKYKVVLAIYDQALKNVTWKAIEATVFIARRRRPQGTSTICSTGGETTWSAANDVPRTEIQDLPLKEEDANARSSQAWRASLGHK